MTLTITFTTGDAPQSFHVGSGYGLAGRIDRALRRDSKGLPFLPGASIKGKLRHACTEICHAFGHVACTSACPPGTDACIICRIFGSPFLQGKLAVFDGKLAHDNPDDSFPTARVWHERNAVAIDRRLQTARPGHLFKTEVAPEGMALHAELRGDLEEQELELLKAAVRVTYFFGGDSSRGTGGCQCDLQ